MKCFRYEMMAADRIANVHEHPQRQMGKLGYTVTNSEACPLMDCWVFEVKEDDNRATDYLVEVDGGFFNNR